jgi:hypothetical protein
VPADAVLICVFREPENTVESILKECAAMPYMRSLSIDETIGFEVYTRIYERCLAIAGAEPERTLFVHYDQVVSGNAEHRLAKALDAPVSCDFADPSLRRSISNRTPPAATRSVYLELCARAGYAAGS